MSDSLQPDSSGFIPIADIARELNRDESEVEAVASIEVDLDEWNEDMDAVTSAGRDAILVHFNGGVDPE